jgi:hypothetical protein
MFASRCIGIFLLVALPAMALAQTAAPTDFKSLANLVVNIITAATAVVIGLGVLYYLWGIIVALKDGGSAKGWEKFRTLAPWGIFILFVMVMIWGILRVLGNTLFP